MNEQIPDDGEDDARPRHTWNYRIIYHNDVPTAHQWIGLHEAHYSGETIVGWTVDAVSFGCDIDEGAAGIVSSLEMALQDARERPLLLMTTLKAEMKERDRLEAEAAHSKPEDGKE